MGGAQLLLPQFATAAAQVGIRLSVACLWAGPAGQRLQAVGVNPVRINVPGRLGICALREVGKYIASVKPDILHTHFGTSDILGSLAARLLNIPVVSSIHAMDWSGGDAREPARLALQAIARRHCAARIIAVSESARGAYLAHGWDRPHRILTIHNGIDVSPKAGSGVAVRRELGLRPEDFVVGMVSALRPEKGHDIAIAAVQLLRSRCPQLRLLIAGEGAAGQMIARLAEPHGDAVVLTGARSDIMSLFDSLDICLHPSRADAFPTTLLEAMAASVPVIASSVGGIPEMVNDGYNGILVPAPPTAESVADAIARLMKDPRRRRELAEAGRRRYQARFTAGPWVCRTRAVYETVLVEAGSALSARHHAGVTARTLRRASDIVASSLFVAPHSASPAPVIHCPSGSRTKPGDGRQVAEHSKSDQDDPSERPV